jgi:hypothetical protein
MVDAEDVIAGANVPCELSVYKKLSIDAGELRLDLRFELVTGILVFRQHEPPAVVARLNRLPVNPRTGLQVANIENDRPCHGESGAVVLAIF